jgi:uncharacterized membrane protein YeaQ/YmgE (transglycosylase-associated protein family)
MRTGVIQSVASYFLTISRMDILWFLIVGIVSGWIAGEIMRGSGFGLIGNLIVGLVGAVIGGFLFDMLNIGTYGLLGSIIMSVIGAVVLLFIVNAFRRS